MKYCCSFTGKTLLLEVIYGKDTGQPSKYISLNNTPQYVSWKLQAEWFGSVGGYNLYFGHKLVDKYTKRNVIFKRAGLIPPRTHVLAIPRECYTIQATVH